MEIIEYFTIEDKNTQNYWLEQIKKSDWHAGQHLYTLLKENKLKELCGEQTLLALLTDGNRLVSFCNYGLVDDARCTELGPWLGFCYTFPEYRGHNYLGKLLDYFECILTIMGREAVYISTNHNGLYEKYGYEFFKIDKDLSDEDTRIYRKILKGDSVPNEVFKDRELRGNEYKAKIVAGAKKMTENPVAPCGFSCNHCFLGEWCGNCRSVFNCCSFATLFPKGKCPNIECCKEKQIEGCWECSELENCSKGFYGNKDGGNDCKAQALFIKKYGLENYLKMQNKLHSKFKSDKIQEILKDDVQKSLEILEKIWQEYNPASVLPDV